MPLSLLDLIDLRAFSSLWYWIVVGVLWARISQTPLGVPIDMVRAAETEGDQARDDLEAIAEIMIRRRLGMAEALGVWRIGLWAFALTLLFGLALGYGLELAQAVLLIAAPMALVSLFSHRAAVRIAAGGTEGARLRRRLVRLKYTIQIIGLVSVFVTAIWGMYANLARVAL